jgi:tRNA(adenine34) deaminase
LRSTAFPDRFYEFFALIKLVESYLRTWHQEQHMTCTHYHGNSSSGNSDCGNFDHDDSNPVSQLYSRRGLVVALASTTLLCADPPLASAFATAEDQAFMRLALDEARHGDYPFGAVIVRDGKVIARGRNLGKVHDDPTAHAEMRAIRRCLAENGSAALRGSTLYASGEPCAMCMGAIIWCHVGRLVFAASIKQLATKINQIMVPCADIAANAPSASITIKAGVLADEAMKLFDK